MALTSSAIRPVLCSTWLNSDFRFNRASSQRSASAWLAVFPSPLFLDTSKCSLFQCLIVLVFEVHRRLVLQRAVEPAPVVNGFNVFENHTPQPVLGPVGTLLQSLAFERAPERFHRRVVVAVGFS